LIGLAVDAALHVREHAADVVEKLVTALCALPGRVSEPQPDFELSFDL
jgi:hypothetical protein